MTTTPTRPARRLAPADLALVAFFAALTATCALIPGIPLGSGVPITLQTFAIGLGAAVLGARRGTLAVLLYVVLGLAGLPIFSGGAGGLAVLAGPSVGYILAWPFATLLIGFLVERLPRQRVVASIPLVFACVLAGSVVFIHPMGIVGLWLRIPETSFGQAVLYDLPFWPGDLVKCALVAVVAVSVHRAFPDLLPRRR
ncbi:biotin transporter BioY [Solicola sp. PLA-1-18]|uniref:biotin transporter BioY n=1 Tax=Solicola sp. PLA-1-18 TaxID=3380532 RepID=UPI003B7D4D0B